MNIKENLQVIFNKILADKEKQNLDLEKLINKLTSLEQKDESNA